MADRIGSIEPGKRADLVVHGGGPAWVPPGQDPVLQLVWGSDGRAVRDVVIDGRVVVRDGQATAVDGRLLRAEAAEVGRRLMARAGIRRDQQVAVGQTIRPLLGSPRSRIRDCQGARCRTPTR